jgi:ADP-heptose:LPS heptosyltransferase
MLDFKITHKLPFKYEIPSYIDRFLGRKRVLKASIKYLKRYFFITLIRQRKLESHTILSSHKNILWINISAPSIGDSLMDLSSRVMIKDREIDLFTDKYNAMIYKGDSVFSSVFSDIKEITQKKYDLVIIDSFSTRSLRVKVKLARFIPFVTMYGYFNGPEVNRVLFSYHKMNSLLGYKLNKSEITKIAKPSINISNNDISLIDSYNLPNVFIAVVVGGEWGFRTFNKWDLVIEKLIAQNQNQKIILIGSNNGREDAKLIVEKLENSNIINYVSKLTFNQTAEIMKRAQYILCCDGGLMHAANSVSSISVTLLAKLNSDMQLTEANESLSIFDLSNVNNISVDSILNKCEEAASLIQLK